MLRPINKPAQKIAFAEKYLSAAQLVVLSTAAGGDLSMAMTEVSAGRADVGLSDAYTVSQYAKNHPEVTDLFASKPYGITGVSWATRPADTELLNFLNTSIDAMNDSGLTQQWESNYHAPWLHRSNNWQVN